MERAAGDISGERESTAVNDAMEALRWNWGTAYEIDAGEGEYRARRRDGVGGWITATDPGRLANEILADYLLNPVRLSDRAAQ